MLQQLWLLQRAFYCRCVSGLECIGSTGGALPAWLAAVDMMEDEDDEVRSTPPCFWIALASWTHRFLSLSIMLSGDALVVRLHYPYTFQARGPNCHLDSGNFDTILPFDFNFQFGTKTFGQVLNRSIIC